MDGLRRTITYQFSEAIKGLAIFLGVLLIFNIIILFANSYFSNMLSFEIGKEFEISIEHKISIAAGNFMAIFIFLVAYNYSIYYETFPIAISFSITRKDFYRSTLLNNILVVSLIALTQGILFKIEPKVIRALGMNPIQNFGIFNTETHSLIYIAFIMFLSFLSFISLWNLVAVLNYKFGYKFWIVIALVCIISSFMLALNYTGIFEWIDSIFSIFDFIFSGAWINYRFDFIFLIVSIILTIAFYIIGYLVTIRTNLKHK